MSDTPETDQLLSDQHHDCVPFDDSCGQLAELCRKLERERDDAFQQLEIAQTLNAGLATELYEWRMCAENLVKWVRSRASFDLEALEGLNEFKRLKEASK